MEYGEVAFGDVAAEDLKGVVGEIFLQIDPAQRVGDFGDLGQLLIGALSEGERLVEVAARGFGDVVGQIVERDRIFRLGLAQRRLHRRA